MRALRAGLRCCLACVLAFAGSASAQQVVIYRCTDAAGHVTLQNDEACPAGTRERRQVVDAPTSVPAFVAPAQPELYTPAAAKEPTATATAPGAAVVARAAPPALFQCRTWDQASYFSTEAKPREHCAPLQVVGLDGVSRPQASACEKVADQCEAVPPERLCEAWKHRVDEAEFRWRFAGPDGDANRRTEFEALAAEYANSNCASR